MIKRIIAHSIVAVLVLGACIPPPKKSIDGTATIPVANERLYLAPLIIQSHLEKLPGWPSDLPSRKILMNEFDEVSRQLYSEFVRCEKYGYYKMVDQTSSPTVRISITLLPFEIRRGVLQIPVRLQVEQLASGQKYSYTLSSSAHFESSSDKQTYLSAGALLADYQRNFPYRSVVRYFYPYDDTVTR